MKLILISISFLFLISCEKQKYCSGRDTYESFGDGSLEILRGPDKEKSFYNCEVGRCYIWDVRKWKVIKRVVYAYGFDQEKNEIFVKVNMDDFGEEMEYSSFNEMPDEDLVIFKKLKK